MSSSKVVPLVTGNDDEYASDPFATGNCMRKVLGLVRQNDLKAAYESAFRILMNGLHMGIVIGVEGEIPLSFKSMGEMTSDKDVLISACRNVALEVVKELRDNGDKPETRLYAAALLQNLSCRLDCMNNPAFKKRMLEVGAKGMCVSDDFFKGMVAPITEQDPTALGLQI